MEMGLRARLEQRLRMAPQILQSIEILQLATLDLKDRIDRELEENPALEAEPPAEESPADAPASEALDRLEAFDEEWRQLLRAQAPRRSGGEDGDRKLEAMQNIAAPSTTLATYIVGELHLLPLTDRIRAISEILAGNLDPNGYLRYPLEEMFPGIAPEPGPDGGGAPAAEPPSPGTPAPGGPAPAPVEPPAAGDEEPEAGAKPPLAGITREEVEESLDVIQRIGPPGVGARNLRECLLLQVPLGEPDNELLRRLISDHLHELEGNRLPALARALGCGIEDVQRLRERLRGLNPRPGCAFAQDASQAVVPDIVVKDVDGHYDIQIEDRWLPRLSVSDRYAKLLLDPNLSPTERDYLRRRVEAARWILEAIAQRRQTLYRITKAILDVQGAFLEEGITHLRPLKMQEVADRVGIHVSNVSRAISDKYIETPRGILPLKFFFTGATPSANGTVTSRVAVKQRVQEIIGREDGKRPLSDDEIADLLKAEGLQVARRTVTKYRKMLKVPSSRQRRVY